MADLVWNANAVRDLTRIAAFISESSPNRAIGFILRIIEATERLQRFPSMGRVVPEFSDPERRELIFQNYRVIYRYRADTVASSRSSMRQWIWKRGARQRIGSSPSIRERQLPRRGMLRRLDV